jgi:uncharacterized protein
MNAATAQGTVEEKERRLKARLAELGQVAVAFSGGVDSSYLLSAALDVLGPARVLALTADSPLIPRRELAQAGALAGRLGAAHRVIPLDPLSEPAVANNPPDRCYYCKRMVFSALQAEARRAGFPLLLHGANADDWQDYRPGQRAAEELGVVAPLDEVGLTKAEIRELSRRRGLPTWDAPAQACLATRLPFGATLSAPALRMIERAEDYLRERFGLRALRVRAHGRVARLELPPADWPAVLDVKARQELLATFAEIGFGAVALDLAGLRSGSMNALSGFERNEEAKMESIKRE